MPRAQQGVKPTRNGWINIAQLFSCVLNLAVLRLLQFHGAFSKIPIVIFTDIAIVMLS